jgi:hypothetical protein
MPGKQTTTPEGGGWPLEVGLEPRGKAGALSVSPASDLNFPSDYTYAGGFTPRQA